MPWISGERPVVRRAALFSILVCIGCLTALAGAQSATPQNETSSQKPGIAAISPPLSSAPQLPIVRFLVLLDPAHGGTDPGALLGAAGAEKNYTLALALRLRPLLEAGGIRSILARSNDVTATADERAAIANRGHATACILLHATATGTGVHLFTSSLPAVGTGARDPRRVFLPWRTAQASYVTQSLRLESDINSALAERHIPALLGRTSLMPLDSMACPAVAIEVAPLDAATPLNDSAYQQQIANSLASALTAWRTDWKQQP